MDEIETYATFRIWVPKVLVVFLTVFTHIYIRRSKQPNIKQWLSTLIGLLCVFFGLGHWAFLHYVLMVLVNILIIRCSKRYCFIISFVYSFLHLGFFFLIVYLYPQLPGVRHGTGNFLTGLVMKMVHLAREVQDVTEIEQNTKKELAQRLKVYTNLSVVDILHYSFSHVSLLSGFLRYRTYHDWIHHPLSEYAVHNQIHEVYGMVPYLVFCGILCLVLEQNPQIQILHVDSFQSLHPLWQLVTLQRMGIITYILIYAAWAMGDVVLITSGIGVYPVSTNPQVGLGPTTNLELLEEISNNPAKARIQEYSSDTIRHIFLYKVFTLPTIRPTWRYYNCHGYCFLRDNIYFKFPIKRLRLLATFTVSAYFHGWGWRYYIVWLYVAICMGAEDVWKDIVKSNGSRKRVLNLIFWTSKMYAVGEVTGMLVVLLKTDLILTYLHATHYFPLLYPITMFILGSCVRSCINKYAFKSTA